MKSFKRIGRGLSCIILFFISFSTFAGENTFYRYSDLKVSTTLPRLIMIGEACQISAIVRNEGGYAGTTVANLYINDYLVDSREVALLPAEEQEVVFEVVFSKTQLHKITIANLAPYILRAYKVLTTGPKRCRQN